MIVVVPHARRGLVRIPVDVKDKGNAVAQAKARKRDDADFADYTWDEARVED